MKLGIHSGVCVTEPNFFWKLPILKKSPNLTPKNFFDFSKNRVILLAGNSINSILSRPHVRENSGSRIMELKMFMKHLMYFYILRKLHVQKMFGFWVIGPPWTVQKCVFGFIWKVVLCVQCLIILLKCSTIEPSDSLHKKGTIYQKSSKIYSWKHRFIPHPPNCLFGCSNWSPRLIIQKYQL